MIRIGIGPDKSELLKLCVQLRGLANKRRDGQDVKTIQEAIEKLMLLQELRSEIRQLAVALLEIEIEHQTFVDQYPDHLGANDLWASTLAIQKVLEFLRPIPSRNLAILRDALVEVLSGASLPAMFHPEYGRRGRRPDAYSIVAAKGIIAGMMQVQMSTGMTRREAARWIVRNVSPSLARRISTKALSPRVIEEWLDRYGGKFAENNSGRERYLLWREHNPVDPRRFREITDSIAQDMPARKHI